MGFSVTQALLKAQKHQKRGEILQAQQVYGQILERFPKNAKALKGAAVVAKLAAAPVEHPSQAELNHLASLFREGQFENVDQYAASLKKRFPRAAVILNIQGMANVSLNAHKKAIDCFDQALALNPNYSEAQYNRGVALRHSGHLDDAIESFQLSLNTDPQNAAAYYNIGHIKLDQELFAEAEENLRASIAIDPTNAESHNNLGNALQQRGKVEEAIQEFERALTLNPNYSEALSNLGIAQESLGEIEGAKESFQEALKNNPRLAETHKNLSGLKKYRSRDSQVVEMETLLTDQNLSDINRMYLSFALGKAEGDLKNYAESFAHLKTANDLRKAMSGYSIDQDRTLFAKIKHQFSTHSFQVEKTDNVFSDGNDPIFILGMPRSGTSLVEQILASHSEIEGLGELEVMNDGIASIGWPEKPFDGASVAKLKEFYSNEISTRLPGERRFTDKMPGNFRWIGFILASFPNAKIIHTKRDARATCWSIYKNFFNAAGNGYAYNLEDVAQYYRLYEGLMAFWNAKFPTQIYELNYETLTTNQEEETRKLLDFAGLAWEDRCLDFHKSNRVVQTTSVSQVREKMYQGSSEVWRSYEDHLTKMLNNLEA